MQRLRRARAVVVRASLGLGRAILCMGLILAIVGGGSGLSIATTATERPSWSKCGKAMCVCVKTTAPACPLCPPSGICPDQRDATLEDGLHLELASSGDIDLAIEAFVASLVILLGSGHAAHAPQHDADMGPALASSAAMPGSRSIDLDTPPPRAA